MNYKNQCISLVRKELVSLYNSKKSFLDSDVLKKSQQLDELINKYHYYNLNKEIKIPLQSKNL